MKHLRQILRRPKPTPLAGLDRPNWVKRLLPGMHDNASIRTTAMDRQESVTKNDASRAYEYFRILWPSPKNRAVITLDADADEVSIIAIFYGGQDYEKTILQGASEDGQEH